MLETIFLGLQVQQWIVIACVVAAFCTLLFTKSRPEAVFFWVISGLYLTGVLTIEESFSGFDTQSVIIVGILFLVVAGLKYTGALAWMVKKLMGQPKTYARAIVRMMVPVSIISAFSSNTATTELFQDVIKKWADKLGMSPSKLLMPLAYAASLGGLLTLIGTPPNLIIAGMYATSTNQVLNIFAPFPVAICCLIVSIVIIILCRRLFPDRVSKEANSEVDVLSFPTTKKTFVSLGVLVAMIVVSAIGIFPLAACCLVAALLMFIFRCCNAEQAEKEVDWNVILVFAGSLCIGTAVHKVGLDAEIANGIMAICGTNPYMVLTAVCVVASLTTELISDTACGALFFPIAYQAAVSIGANPMTFCIALMMAVSNNYATPISTPPNTIVFISGGYKFGDFARVGLILKVAMLAVAIGITPLIYPF